MAIVWVDVEDLLDYMQRIGRPTGIQRLTFELCAALHEGGDPRIAFVRHDRARGDFQAVAWEDVAAQMQAALDGPARAPDLPRAAPEQPANGYSGLRLGLRRQVQRLPAPVQIALLFALRQSAAALSAWARLARVSADSLAGMRRHRRPAASHQPPRGFASAAPGDVLLAPGAPWAHPHYAALIARQRARGLRFALLVYDLIPLRYPEWCDGGVVRRHRHFIDTCLPLCDRVFAISRATAADVTAYAAETGIALVAPVGALPLGSGFGAPAVPRRTPRLPPPGSYVLFVSTLEARKNHILAFRVWRQLLRDLPAERVPTLVFAGRQGWLVADLMQQIANSRHLDGKLMLVDGPGDGELAALYEGCRFTIFPSLAEGWGLPVTESLAYGKPCLIADNTSLPEAGMGLARSFDADNLHDAVAAVRALLDHPEELVAWQARIRDEFRPVPWSASAAWLMAALLPNQPA